MTEPLPENDASFHDQRDWLLVTLWNIGDAVITTDGDGRVAFLNPIAESLTGWTQDAVAQPLDGVIRLVNEESRQPVEVPSVQALAEGRTLKLPSIVYSLRKMAQNGRSATVPLSSATTRGRSLVSC